MGSEKETQRSLRLRDNKRRHRARQKEYTAELERKLSALQREGVQATTDVQRSARKVVHENRCLRALLRHVEVDEQTINRWVAEKGGERDEERDCRWKRACSKRNAGGIGGQADFNVGDSKRNEYNARGSVTASAPLLEQEQICLPYPAQTDPKDSNDLCIGDVPLQRTNGTSVIAENRSPIEDVPLSSGDPETNRTCRQGFSVGPSDTGASFTSRPPAPCKLLTHLAANPGADITQMPTASDEEELNPSGADDAVSCSSAYRMLMHYATTDSKLDAVAHILEEGCVATAEPGKGCGVKNKTIWKALDDICL